MQTLILNYFFDETRKERFIDIFEIRLGRVAEGVAHKGCMAPIFGVDIYIVLSID